MSTIITMYISGRAALTRQPGERRRRRNAQLKYLSERLDVVDEIRRKRLKRAGRGF